METLKVLINKGIKHLLDEIFSKNGNKHFCHIYTAGVKCLGSVFFLLLLEKTHCMEENQE